MQLLRDHFYYNQRFNSKEALFEAVSKRLLHDGYVKNGYYDALVSREQKYPTGIESRKAWLFRMLTLRKSIRVPL